MPLAVEDWAAQVRAGEVRAISRAITAIENHAPEAEDLLRRLFPHTGKAYLTGVTGAPGTGKSTLVDRLAAFHRKNRAEVGVIAVDPTSPRSEEHTSELQSLTNLVCRLLLEKKKKKPPLSTPHQQHARAIS